MEQRAAPVGLLGAGFGAHRRVEGTVAQALVERGLATYTQPIQLIAAGAPLAAHTYSLLGAWSMYPGEQFLI